MTCSRTGLEERIFSWNRKSDRSGEDSDQFVTTVSLSPERSCLGPHRNVLILSEGMVTMSKDLSHSSTSYRFYQTEGQVSSTQMDGGQTTFKVEQNSLLPWLLVALHWWALSHWGSHYCLAFWLAHLPATLPTPPVSPLPPPPVGLISSIHLDLSKVWFHLFSFSLYNFL